MEKVRNYYNEGALHEWDRHDRHMLEFPVTMHFILRELPVRHPSTVRILDSGSGPGRYSLDLSARGFKVNLLDLSPVQIELAEAKARSANVSFESARAGDARDLSAWKDEAFDAVLCLGPLYHILDEADRRCVLRESTRVLKPGGLLAAAFISRYAPVFDLAKRYPQNIAKAGKKMREYLDCGIHIQEEGNPGFVDAWFADPSEIEGCFSDLPLQKITLFGAEGGLAQSEPSLVSLDEEDRRHWIDMAISLAPGPAGIFASEHIVFLGRKT